MSPTEFPIPSLSGIVAISLHTEGQYAEKLWIEAPSPRYQPAFSNHMIESGKAYPQMDGPFVFRHAVVRMPQVVREVLKACHLGTADIDMFLFHQANLRINEMVAKTLDIPKEKTFNNIDKYGNCSAASLPMCLDETVRAGKIKRGSLVCMTAFGSGFSWGSAVIRW